MFFLTFFQLTIYINHAWNIHILKKKIYIYKIISNPVICGLLQETNNFFFLGLNTFDNNIKIEIDFTNDWRWIFGSVVINVY